MNITTRIFLFINRFTLIIRRNIIYIFRTFICRHDSRTDNSSEMVSKQAEDIVSEFVRSIEDRSDEYICKYPYITNNYAVNISVPRPKIIEESPEDSDDDTLPELDDTPAVKLDETFVKDLKHSIFKREIIKTGKIIKQKSDVIVNISEITRPDSAQSIESIPDFVFVNKSDYDNGPIPV